ncbi:hypothetical protein [Paenibacillus sp. NPDC101420]|uniref:hypothetical protein n=1 Tax=Paenibacillus sp. NPDC101420 TaxID=3390602 RepID=UPI003D000386
MDIKRNNFESIGLLMSKLTIWIYEVLALLITVFFQQSYLDEYLKQKTDLIHLRCPESQFMAV